MLRSRQKRNKLGRESKETKQNKRLGYFTGKIAFEVSSPLFLETIIFGLFSFTPSYVNYNDSSVIVNSYYEGAYDDQGNEYPAALTEPIRRAGFHLKEGKYVANLKSNSSTRAGEVVFGPDAYGGYPTSGIKGYVHVIIKTVGT